MIQTLAYLVKFRDWQGLGIGAAAGLLLALGVLHISVADPAFVWTAAGLLALGVGTVLGMAIVFSYCALRVVRKLHEQNVRRDFALNNMAQGLSMFDRQGRLVVWNKNYETMFGLGPVIRRGCSLGELLAVRHAAGTLPNDPKKYEANLRAALDHGKIFTNEVELEDGRIIAVVNRPTKEGGWVATHEDITERKRSERELENTRAFLDMIVENVLSPIIVKDAKDLTYLLVNRATEDYFGIDRVSIVGKSAGDILPPSLVDTIGAEDAKAIESGDISYQGEHGVVTPGNGTRVVTATRLPVKDSDGKAKYLITVINDITESKRSEQRIDIGDQDIGGAHQLHVEAGVEHIRRGHAGMHVARFGADDFRNMGQEGDDVVLDLGLDGVDARDIELGVLALGPDRGGCFLRDDAEFGHGGRRVRLDLEPDAEFGFRRPDRHHVGT